MTHDAFQQQVIEDLAELKTHMKSLIGNGQPGRIANLEKKVDGLEAHRNQWIGKSSIIAIIISALITLGIVLLDNYHENSIKPQRTTPAYIR